MTEIGRVRVAAERDYDVAIGRGIVETVPECLPGASQVAIIAPAALARTASTLGTALADAGTIVTAIEVPDAEQAKTAAVLEDCWTRLGQAGFTRSDGVIGLGGGATTDLAGFVAATWLRGVRVVQVPTTLLGMVDAAIGGKTGINTGAGKNLVGAFHSPAAVVCDLDLLRTVPDEDLRAGMAEVVKVGFTSDPTILDDVRRDPAGCLAVDGALIGDLVRRAVQVKADVVSRDFREESATGPEQRLGREVLNYGHTFGHAVELVEDYRWRHGDAVSVGLCFVAQLARLGGRLDPASAALHAELLGLLGLPTRYAGDRWPALEAAMRVDKKARGSVLRFVVLQAIGEPVTWAGPDEDLLREAYRLITAD